MRDKVGGVEEARNTFFETTQPEMGDEGRVPPPLDGVGAKLQPEYLKQILDKGAQDRPYMLHADARVRRRRTSASWRTRFDDAGQARRRSPR